MSEAEKKNPQAEDKNDEQEFGWEFHKVPLAVAAVLTVIFYVIVYWLAGVRP